MKKVFLFIGSFLLMFVLLGCDEEGNFSIPTDTTFPTGELTTDEFTTDETTTETPTTIDGTTETPTTETPTTEEPTTETPTTEVPTTEEPTTVEPEPVVLLDRPTNLSIDGTTLSWAEVPNAVGYSVYVDGNFQAEVTTNEYDFSSIVEDYMVFNVKALAYAEESDSNLSLDIVYNVNAASDILALETFIASSGMSVSDSQAFATELVSRGMTVTEMQTMMTNMEPVMTKLQNQASMGEIYPDLHTFINGMDNIEALVSAFVRVELPNAIQDEIDYLTTINGTCEFENSYNDGSGEIITECYEYYDVTEEIEYLNRLLIFVENHPDEVVESVMVVVNYFIRIENAMSAQWFSDVDTLIGSTSPGPFNVSLAVSVKNGLVNNFKDQMPTLNEFTIFNQMMMSFANTMLDDDGLSSFIQAENSALQMQLSLGLVFDALLQIDADYINNLMIAVNSEDKVTIITLQLDFINQFLDDHSVEIQALNDVYTAEEKEAIFFDLIIANILVMEGFNETEQTEVMAIIKDNIDFTNLLAMKSTTYDLFNDFLDRLDETDYELISALVDLSKIPSSNIIESDDDDGDAFNFNIDGYLEPGQYIVMVRGFSSGDVGDYDLYVYTDSESGMVLLNSFSDTLVEGINNYHLFTITEPTYVNIYTDSDLDTYGELSIDYDVNMSRDQAMFNLFNALLDVSNPMVQNMTEAEYSVYIENVVSIVKTMVHIENYDSTMPMDPDQLLAIEQLLDILTDTTPHQFVMFQTIINQMHVNDYFTEMELAEDTQDMAQKIIIHLDLVNDVLDASALEFDALDEIYTDEEKEDIFFDLIIGTIIDSQAYTETEKTEIYTIIESNIDFSDLLQLHSLSNDLLNDVLDQLALTDYELVHAFVDLMKVESAYYEDLNQYDLDKAEAMAYLIDSFVNTMNPLMQDMTEAEYTILMTNAISIFKTSFYIEEYNYPMRTEDEMVAIELVFDTIINTTPEQFAILQTAMNQVELSDLIMNIYNIYYVSTATVTPDEQDFGMLIEFANVYVDTYDLVETDIDALIADAIVLLDNPTIQAELLISSEEVASIKAMIQAYPEDLYTQALVVVDYDYTNLTATQIEELQELIYLIESLFVDQTTTQ